jgi:hypothetical protein
MDSRQLSHISNAFGPALRRNNGTTGLRRVGIAPLLRGIRTTFDYPRSRAIFALLVGLSMVGVNKCVAQSVSFSGTVSDPKGKPLANVGIEFSTRSQGRSITGTDENGKYAVSGLPPGDYQVTFELAGYTTVVRIIHVKFGGDKDDDDGKAGDVTLAPQKVRPEKK